MVIYQQDQIELLDTGTQYFTFAFRRQLVANFTVNINSSTGIHGLWIAAPGTQIDSTSGLNGWLNASTTYAGSGVPGSGAGGNGRMVVHLLLVTELQQDQQ